MARVTITRARIQILILGVLLVTAQLTFATEPVEYRLWEGTAPGNEGAESVTETVEDRGTADAHDRKVSGVTVPTITVYCPAPAMNTGTAVLIVPGGGYSSLAIDKEGHDIARYFNTIGVTGIVLKHRLPRPEGFVFHHDVPLRDGLRAMRLARYHGDEWGLKPNRIGIMGFSAGGHLASTVATRFDDGISESADPVERLSSRPDFQVLVYPVVSFKEGIGHTGSRNNLVGKDASPDLDELYSNELHVSAESPPAFLVSTYDDRVKAENSLLYFKALRAAGAPAELHVYEVGGHGYGIRPTGKPVATWHHRLADWMKQRGLLNR